MKNIKTNIPDIAECKTNIEIGRRRLGSGHPVYIIAEIGINHNGDLESARHLIDAAYEAGCDAVKFQKRTPEICVPAKYRDMMRETPWGTMTYLEYRNKIEFGRQAYQAIDKHCRKIGIDWFASCWDIPSIEFIQSFDPSCYKVASANLTDLELLHYLKKLMKPVILSTGMSTMDQIRTAVNILSATELMIAHCTSNYSCAPEELNLQMISTLRDEFRLPIGYSGHEADILPSCIAVALGACFVERHITLDRKRWGSDQTASLEPDEFKRLVSDIRKVETVLGDGVKKVYRTEWPAMKKLRNSC